MSTIGEDEQALLLALAVEAHLDDPADCEASFGLAREVSTTLEHRADR